jgi:signal transduction histidine kinase
VSLGNGSFPNEPLNDLARIAEELRVLLASHRAELRRAGISFPKQIVPKAESLIESLNALGKNLADFEIEKKNLEALVQIGQVINSSLDPTIVLNEVVDTIIRLTGAERAFLMLRDKEDEMDTVIARNWERESLRPDEYELSQSIIGQVMEGAHSIVTTNAQNDPRFGNQASVITYSLRSILCVPMIVKEEIIGVIYADNRAREGLFTEKEGQLLFAFANQAAIAIENSRLYETIRRHADELEERVAERTLELAEANRTLRALSVLKDEFVSNVSHELRTPISSLKLYGALIETPNEKFPQYITAVQREINRLEHIIESLLRLSSLDQDQVAVYLAPTDLNKLVESLVSDRTVLAADRNLTLASKTDPDLPPAIADQELLTEAVSILLTNALNYTPSGGSIHISTEMLDKNGGSWFVIHVADSGPGIPDDEGGQFFQRFFRGKVGRESGYAGTGLGLSIVKEIVERNQGEVEAKNQGIDGDGATFSIWLPLSEEGPDKPSSLA